MEDILIKKIEKIAKTQQIIDKCKEKENCILKMCDDRILQLSSLQKNKWFFQLFYLSLNLVELLPL